ncbi:MAG: hypothetical protein ACREP8_01420 [Candidatus Binatia bacterium]
MDVRRSLAGLLLAATSFAAGAISEAATVPSRLLTTEGSSSSSPAQGSALQSPATGAPTPPGTDTTLPQSAVAPQSTTAAVLSTPPLSTGAGVAGDSFQCLIANVGITPGNVSIQIVDASGAVAGQSDVSLNPGEVKHSKISAATEEQQHYCNFVVRDGADGAGFRGAACIQDSFGRCVTAVPAQ